jgi:hypothetical protein
MTAPIAPPVVLTLELDVEPLTPAVLAVEPPALPEFADGSPPDEVQSEPQTPPFEGTLHDAGEPALDRPSSLGAPPLSEPIETN